MKKEDLKVFKKNFKEKMADLSTIGELNELYNSIKSDIQNNFTTMSKSKQSKGYVNVQGK